MPYSFVLIENSFSVKERGKLSIKPERKVKTHLLHMVFMYESTNELFAASETQYLNVLANVFFTKMGRIHTAAALLI